MSIFRLSHAVPELCMPLEGRQMKSPDKSIDIASERSETYLHNKKELIV